MSAPELPGPITDIAYDRDDVPRLPSSLEEAIAAFEADRALHACSIPNSSSSSWP
jgi:glutamine synthetase